jgi:hypothetical protein
MTLRHLCIGAVSAVALVTLSNGGQAAPLSGAGVGLKADASINSGIEKATYRRCWWRHGRRVCRLVGYRTYRSYDDDGYYGPYYGYGYGPSIGFSFGGGGRHHGHHRRR